MGFFLLFCVSQWLLFLITWKVACLLCTFLLFWRVLGGWTQGCVVGRNQELRSWAKASKLSIYENILANTISMCRSSIRSGILLPEGCGVLCFRPAVSLCGASWAVLRLVTCGVIVICCITLGTVLRWLMVNLQNRAWLSCFIFSRLLFLWFFIFFNCKKIWVALFCFCRFDKMIQVLLSISWHELLALGKSFSGCFLGFLFPSPVHLIDLWAELGGCR